MYKVVLLGEGRVGKTSLISRFVNNQFDAEEASTVQASMYNKKKISVDGRTVSLSIWDTAGQERFHALGPIYYRNANGAVLVYDTTDADTLEKVKMWIKELKAVVGDSIPLVICGNKSDMERDRDVDVATAEALAAKENATHFNTSAKLNLNVQEAFEALVRTIVAQETGSGDAGLSAPTSSSGRTTSGTSGGSSKKKRGGLRIDESSTAVVSGTQSDAATVTTSQSQQPTVGHSYADYDDPPHATTNTPSTAATRPRNQTIILSEAPRGTSSSTPANSNRKDTPNEKKKGGCCS